MKVRTATRDDFDVLIAMGETSHQEGAHKDKIFSKDALMRFGETCLALPDSFTILIAEHENEIAGLLVGYISPQIFTTETYAGDLIVYVSPKWRGTSAAFRLLHAFEHWAKARGVFEMRLGITTGISPERTQRFYEKVGYSYVGPTFVKKLKEN